MENENRFSDRTESEMAGAGNTVSANTTLEKAEEKIPAKPALRTDLYLRKPLRVSDIVHGLRKHVKMIVICAAAGLVLGIILSIISYMRGEMSKQYAVKTTIGFTSQNQNGNFLTESGAPSNTDIHLAEDMVDAVMYVLKSDKMLNRVVEDADLLGVSTRDIYANLNLAQYNKTQIIDVTLYWRSAQEGVKILESLNKVAPKVLIDTLKIGNVTVINEPTARYIIGGNLNVVLWGFMMAIGAVFGLGLAVLDLMVRPTLLSASDMERDFRIEVLGEIPEKNKYFRKKRNPLETYEDDEANSDLLDNYMSLAQTVKMRIRSMEHPCIYMTSATQNEGKTTAAAYTAAYLAELGLRVLLVDLDTKNPTLGGIFLPKVEYENSLNALYKGECGREDAIISLNAKLDLLPAVLERKPLPMDYALLDMVSTFIKDYDIVILDTAPVGQSAETMSLSGLADQCLLVIKYDGAGMNAIREAINRLDKSGTEIMGCVVNGVRNFWGNRTGYGNAYGVTGIPKSQGRSKKKSIRQQEWEEWEKEHAETEGSDLALDPVTGFDESEQKE